MCLQISRTDEYKQRESGELSSEQNKIEENVIVYVCAMTLLEIIHFPLGITQDG